MTIQELNLVAKLSEIDAKNIDDDEIADIIQDSLVIADNDSYEAITFITENSEISYDTIQRVYKTFLNS